MRGVRHGARLGKHGRRRIWALRLRHPIHPVKGVQHLRHSLTPVQVAAYRRRIKFARGVQDAVIAAAQPWVRLAETRTAAV